MSAVPGLVTLMQFYCAPGRLRPLALHEPPSYRGLAVTPRRRTVKTTYQPLAIPPAGGRTSRHPGRMGT